MGNLFSVAEIVTVGIEKEKKRRDFYDAVSKKFQEQEMKNLFEKLRDWESEHIEKFQAIKKDISDAQSLESYSGEQQSYMQALINEELYEGGSLDDFMKNVSSPRSAIQYGMRFEREAILFFSQLKDFLREPQHETIQKLVNEEKQHLIYLAELSKKIRS